MIKFLHLFKNYYLGISFIGIAAFVIQETVCFIDSRISEGYYPDVG